jgi:hypothetical protein
MIAVPPSIQSTSLFTSVQANLLQTNQLIGSFFDSWKGNVRVATIGPVILSGVQLIDNVQLLPDDLILVKDQINKIQNGVYIVSIGEWKRSKNMQVETEAFGSTIFVEEGITNHNYIFTTKTGGAIGSSALSFESAFGNGDGGAVPAGVNGIVQMGYGGEFHDGGLLYLNNILSEEISCSGNLTIENTVNLTNTVTPGTYNNPVVTMNCVIEGLSGTFTGHNSGGFGSVQINDNGQFDSAFYLFLSSSEFASNNISCQQSITAQSITVPASGVVAGNYNYPIVSITSGGIITNIVNGYVPSGSDGCIQFGADNLFSSTEKFKKTVSGIELDIASLAIKSSGSATLIGGTVTINFTTVYPPNSSNYTVIITTTSLIGSSGILFAENKVNGSFTVNSYSSGAFNSSDNSSFDWLVIYT